MRSLMKTVLYSLTKSTLAARNGIFALDGQGAEYLQCGLLCEAEIFAYSEQAIGEKGGRSMNQTIYSEAEPDVGEALRFAKRVDDFLPPPSELARAKSTHSKRSNTAQMVHQTSSMPLAKEARVSNFQVGICN